MMLPSSRIATERLMKVVLVLVEGKVKEVVMIRQKDSSSLGGPNLLATLPLPNYELWQLVVSYFLSFSKDFVVKYILKTLHTIMYFRRSESFSKRRTFSRT